MNTNTRIVLSVVMGCVPYHVYRMQLLCGARILRIRALFWSVDLLTCPCGFKVWRVDVPLISRLREFIWAVVAQLDHH